MTEPIDYDKLARAIKDADDTTADELMTGPGWTDDLRAEIPARGTVPGSERLAAVQKKQWRADVHAQQEQKTAQKAATIAAQDARLQRFKAAKEQWQRELAAYEEEVKACRRRGEYIKYPAPPEPDYSTFESTAVALTPEQQAANAAASEQHARAYRGF